MSQEKRIKVGILGATGMVGQTFATLLNEHPWFETTILAASPRSAGKTYKNAVEGRWLVEEKIPEILKEKKVFAVEADLEKICSEVDLVFSALDLEKEKIKILEETFAAQGLTVVSNASAHRWTDDVPMIMPEINPDHASLIDEQRKKRDWKKGFIVVKPNCSIQSYVPLLKALQDLKPTNVEVTTLQALSGAGKSLGTWPEMIDNVIPLISGEEEKSEKEPLKILGALKEGKIALATEPEISATCIRVPVSNGHMASLSIEFEKETDIEEIKSLLLNFNNPIAKLGLPSAPTPFITLFEEDDRPQTKLDRTLSNGMGISFGRIRQITKTRFKMIGLSHNTIRGAAGGAILTAELLKVKGYI